MMCAAAGVNPTPGRGAGAARGHRPACRHYATALGFAAEDGFSTAEGCGPPCCLRIAAPSLAAPEAVPGPRHADQTYPWRAGASSASRFCSATAAVPDKDLVLYIRLDDLPRLHGGNHPLMRDPRGWRLALTELRQRETRGLKARVAKTSREARLRLRLEQVTAEVNAERAVDGALPGASRVTGDEQRR